MSVIVHDLVPAFLDFWTGAQGRPESEQATRWAAFAGRHPEIGNDMIRQGRTPNPTRALREYPNLLPLITTNAGRADQWIRDAYTTVASGLDGGHLDVEAYSIVGLANSNGWTADIHGRPALFLAVEQIPDDKSARILATHEMVHVLHQELMPGPVPDDGPFGFFVFAEGFATQATIELMPEYSEVEHLWFGETDAAWLAACERASEQAMAEISDLLWSDQERHMVTYLAITDKTHVPQRIGYLVGARAVAELRRTYAWAEMARWPAQRAVTELAGVLRSRRSYS